MYHISPKETVMISSEQMKILKESLMCVLLSHLTALLNVDSAGSRYKKAELYSFIQIEFT